MPTINQLVAKPRELQKARKNAPALQQSPQKRGVCTRVYTTTPQRISDSPGRLVADRVNRAHASEIKPLRKRSRERKSPWHCLA